MNWDAVGAVGELVGGIGVIVSLIYLGVQIHRNTLTQKRANLGDIAIELATTARSAATNPDLAGLLLRGYANLDSLDPVERYRFDAFFYAFLANFERALILARSGDYPEEQLVPLRASIAGFLRTVGGRAWWDQSITWFTLFGQQSIDEILNDQMIDSRGAGPGLLAINEQAAVKS
jgi:hypothetical protein